MHGLSRFMLKCFCPANAAGIAQVGGKMTGPLFAENIDQFVMFTTALVGDVHTNFTTAFKRCDANVCLSTVHHIYNILNCITTLQCIVVIEHHSDIVITGSLEEKFFYANHCCGRTAAMLNAISDFVE